MSLPRGLLNSPVATGSAQAIAAQPPTRWHDAMPTNRIGTILVATAVTVLSKTSNHEISTHTIDPNKNYWRNQQKNPGRWPGNL